MMKNMKITIRYEFHYYFHIYVQSIYYLRQGGVVFTAICLSIFYCLLAELYKYYWLGFPEKKIPI